MYFNYSNRLKDESRHSLRKNKLKLMTIIAENLAPPQAVAHQQITKRCLHVLGLMQHSNVAVDGEAMSKVSRIHRIR